MAYRNKTYICFDGDNDMAYYRLMTAWKSNDNFSFNFHNAHDMNSARDESLEESIKKQLRERFANSKTLIVLIGENTKNLTKFVRWEMDVALKLGIPIIAVNLNGSRQKDELCPRIIKNELVVFVSFNMKIIEYAMNNWPEYHNTFTKENKKASFYYTNKTYEALNIK
ncbi:MULTISPECIES: TIR domain-containing protein [Enterobacter]|uniref:TIR domain-containing protein n=1 Tax=Enterobacter TaxID=547 RepID=UPI0003ED19D6|nr:MULTISPECIES: TIR domain-containing protein [Enterobacter]ELP5713396.1 TIR domain-containing protein [Enterobacter asburiae]EMA4736400.1 TIR domain-containing protein [Enterobacter asburiae]EWG70340.1 hypothetical protein P346_01520 [Enterobacter sp. DC1]MBE8905376.1 TIR domain-containing protein [Enterobacter asburiae]NIH90985.1 hypothetical protein [Enterobacter asburiae]